MADSRENKGTEGTMRSRLHKMPDAGSIAKGQRGIALVIVLVMLALLGILGSMVILSSSTELRIAGNYRLSQDAFFIAESSIESAYTDPNIYTAIIPDSGVSESWPRKGEGVACVNPDVSEPDYNCMLFDTLNGRQPALVRVSWETCGALPVGSGASHEASIDSGKAKGNYFLINVLGSVSNQTQTRIAVETYHARGAARCPQD